MCDEWFALRFRLGDVCCFYVFVRLFLLFFFELLVCSVFICVLFEHKCKSLKRLGENRKNKKNRKKQNKKQTAKTRRKTLKKNRNTGYPDLDPTANKYLSGSGWEISVFLFLCFSLSCSVFFVFMCFVDCKCKSLKRLGEHIKTTERNITNNRNNRRKTETKKTKYMISSPRTSANKSHNYLRRFVDWISCIYVVLCFSLSFYIV